MTERERREWAWLFHEAAVAAPLTDADRVRILRDLWRTAEAMRRTKTPEQLAREEEMRRAERLEGLRRYIALAERLE